ncbi:acyl-CoA dehydrogenase family protein [Pseudoclavibacter endophyticus]|uniref:Acyl-CoA dehydrogenase family protein n=1 Tax=Pseudoclavibacter endophyticus TaxID=1778590 RepID=A0A6H9WTB3_9MICO|nr:acyl-CoA dehydrogenase family protein [Pseudoclavibacter endophyticus]KAB1650177.1 acyl-CoA dehydrogenase family protein [Pseudoclavibacter endophyticus]
MSATSPRTILDDDVLAALRDRAIAADDDNAFPLGDLEDLRELGYLRLHVPRQFGGGGLTLEQLVHVQKRLATAAPATALALGMHQVVTGIARTTHERGDASMDWVLREIVDGEVYALGISEAGNDAVLFDSTVRAEPDGDGGYRLSGTKIFTSLSPVWTRLCVFGRDDSDPEHPRLVHGVVRRDDAGITIHDDWDTLGMRATRSCSTTFDHVHVPASRVLATLPVGPNAEPFTFAVFANFLLLIGAAYLGVSERALRIAIDAVEQRTSLVAGGAPLSDDELVRSDVAELGIPHLSALVQLEATARDVDEQAAHGSAWFPRLTAAKLQATTVARRSVEGALDLVGGAGYRSSHELSRLSRDVLASIFHPSQQRSVRRTFANWLLGPVNRPDAQRAADD